MPHVIIDSNINLDLIHDTFRPQEHRYSLNDKTSILKLTDSFQNNFKKRMLIQTISIENNTNSEYFIELIKKLDQITIRLFPLTYPDHKIVNIIRSIAFVSHMIREANKDNSFIVLTTNIQHYLDEFFEP